VNPQKNLDMFVGSLIHGESKILLYRRSETSPCSAQVSIISRIFTWSAIIEIVFLRMTMSQK